MNKYSLILTAPIASTVGEETLKRIYAACDRGGSNREDSVSDTIAPWQSLVRRVFRLAVLCIGCLSVSGCASLFYAKTDKGAFAGKLTVEWIAPNQFVYRPDKDEPLVYTTSDGRRIQPQLMYTDGGSIPRLLWSAPDFGPWDFAPGYIIHDWLFHQHHCQLGDWQSYDFPKSAQVLAEGIKTQMEKAAAPEPTIVYAIYEAVRSPVAEALWNHAPCKTPPSATSPLGGAAPGLVILRIDAK